MTRVKIYHIVDEMVNCGKEWCGCVLKLLEWWQMGVDHDQIHHSATYDLDLQYV